MKVVSIKEHFGKALSGRRPNFDASSHEDTGRALVALSPVPSSENDRGATYRPAAFLSQLIANKEQIAQTRDRRRVEPAEAVRIYQSALTPKPYSRPTLSRSL